MVASPRLSRLSCYFANHYRTVALLLPRISIRATYISLRYAELLQMHRLMARNNNKMTLHCPFQNSYSNFHEIPALLFSTKVVLPLRVRDISSVGTLRIC